MWTIENGQWINKEEDTLELTFAEAINKINAEEKRAISNLEKSISDIKRAIDKIQFEAAADKILLALNDIEKNGWDV